MPTIPSLFGGHAPFKGLQEHMKIVDACAHQVVPLIDALIADDPDQLKICAKEIFRLEEQADVAKNELRMHLPRSLFLPVDRRDLLEVLHHQDTIADRAEDIAGLLIARDMKPPAEMEESLRGLTAGVVAVVGLAAEIIGQLDELLEVGFRGRTADKVEALAKQLNDAETRTDRLERELARRLFELEDQLNPVTVIFWYRLIEWIGALADHAEKVGNNIRLIIAR